MTTSVDIPEDDLAEAGEYVLRLLSASERRRFEARADTDPRLRIALREWEEGLSHLVADCPAQAPPARVKAALDSRIFAAEAPVGLFSRLGVWQFLSGLGLTSAAVLATVVFLGIPNLPWLERPVPIDPAALNPARYFGEIAGQDPAAGQTVLRLVAFFDPAAGSLHLRRTDGDAPSGRALELWVIAGDAAPVSLGVLPQAAASNVPVPVSLRQAVTDGVLAISDEPPGGSPTGQPTGAVLATGRITAL